MKYSITFIAILAVASQLVNPVIAGPGGKMKGAGKKKKNGNKKKAQVNYLQFFLN